MTDATRRDFLRLTGSAAGLSWLAVPWPALLALGQTACSARDRNASFANLDDELASDLAAVAARIIPADETPGAAEAGVIYFIDGALETVMRGARSFLADGVADLNRRVAARHSTNRFAGLGETDQIAVLREADDTPFFGAMKFLTVAGMFAMPAHGGNRDEIGWSLIGFDSRHGWQPPFGHYDVDEHGDD